MRFRPELILCPTDYSEPAAHALRYAGAFARTTKSRLLVIYADSLSPPPYFTAEQVSELVESRKQARRAADLLLETHVRDVLGEGTTAETAMVEGAPASSILRTAEERNAGLIVMGTHGSGGFNRLMMGSVTERVLRETDRPVLSVRKGPVPGSTRIRHILCPVNFTNIAFEAFEYAVDLARLFGAQLVALHVIEPGGNDIEEERLSEVLCARVPDDGPACALTHLVRRGNPSEQIVEAAHSYSCDLIVLGTQHKRFFDSTVVGSTAPRVAQHASCPVVTVAMRTP